MGRFYNLSNGDGGKFWFACQSTADMQMFGGREDGDMLRWQWNKEDDLEFVIKTLQECHLELKQLDTSYREVMRACNKPHPFPKTGSNEQRAQELTARIVLGMKIKKGLREEGYLTGEGEY